MREAARRLEFERAAEIRDQMEALRAFFSTDQQAFDPEMGDLDFLGMARSGALAVVQLYQVRSGRILGRISRVVEKEEATDEEILWAFLRDHYLEASPSPLVLLPFPLEDLESLAELLKRRAGRKVELRVPKKGRRRGSWNSPKGTPASPWRPSSSSGKGGGAPCPQGPPGPPGASRPPLAPRGLRHKPPPGPGPGLLHRRL